MPHVDGSLPPLAQIERRVQQRAKDLDLEVGLAGAAALRRLVDEAVGLWQAEQEAGLHPYGLADPERIADRAMRNLTGYGPLEPLLDDHDVWEIMINGPTQIFAKRHLGESGYHDEVFHDDDHVVRTLTRILQDASSAHRTLDPAEGLQDAQLDDGARLHIVHGDVGRDGHMLVNIRKFTGVAYRDLDELVARDTLSADAAHVLRAAMAARQSIVFAGPPGSGKTTLLSCCAAELDPTLRVVVAEEVFEADVPVPNVAHMQTRAARPDRPAIDLRRLVAGFLRMAPDYAIVGEVRDREALPLMLTLSSGVKGLTTIHAGSARQALTRLRFLCQLSEMGRTMPMSALNSLVAESVDLVVHSAREAGRVRVTEILAVEDLQGGPEATQLTATPLFVRDGLDGPLEWSGQVPARATAAFHRVGIDLAALLDVRSSGALR